ncbi:MAG TPA: hypothetical protein DIT66_08805 [Rhodobiaceae bacterium]|nr:hypothetical protein [Rhodobiaceae bacterium]
MIASDRGGVMSLIISVIVSSGMTSPQMQFYVAAKASHIEIERTRTKMPAWSNVTAQGFMQGS